MTGEAVEVSVVVCTYNRAALLRGALASLTALETDGQFRYEVMVVDNASTDETGAVIAEAARASAVPVRGVHEPRPGVAFARNRGVRETAGPWVAFFDDDQVADPRWLAELMATAREKGARVVGGANRLLYPPGADRKLATFCRGLLGETPAADHPSRYDGMLMPGTGNVVLHRSLFQEVGGFNESCRTAGEDTDLFRRIWATGVERWRTPRAVMHHLVPAYRLTDGYLRWKSLAFGRTKAERDRRNWGPAGALTLLAARLSHAAFATVPRLLWAGLRRAEDRVLESRCLLWQTWGYARTTLHLLAPGLFPQRAFLSWLEFRTERELFAGAAGAGVSAGEHSNGLSR